MSGHSKIRSRIRLIRLVVQFAGGTKLWIFRLAGGNDRGVDGWKRFGGGLPLPRALDDGANAIDLKPDSIGDGVLLEAGLLADLLDLQARRSLLGPRRRARCQPNRQGEADADCPFRRRILFPLGTRPRQ